ncbi:hypothetical protein O988_04449 [Pseudogymnoascus sp. VKM F-3808]|nr:hypothetical protein O988_04449 [Pseudogymnoascus sp. VKM F-3808]
MASAVAVFPALEHAASETILKSNAFRGTEGVYMLPHHAKEIDRLTKQHLFMRSTTDNLQLADPITAGAKELRVLDCGCADGTWLKDLGILYPQINLDLHGVDIGSDLFPRHSNIDLRQHNITTPFPDSFEWNGSFDVIHQRLLVWGLQLSQWSKVLSNLYTILKPGGYIQLVEIEFIDPANPATLPQLQKQALMQKWSTASFGMDIDIAYKLEDLLTEANFTNVTKVQFDHGYGAKARSAAQRDVSAELWVECFRSLDTKIPADGGIPGVAKDAKEFHEFLDSLETEIKTFGYEPKLNFVYAQKPVSADI